MMVIVMSLSHSNSVGDILCDGGGDIIASTPKLNRASARAHAIWAGPK